MTTKNAPRTPQFRPLGADVKPTERGSPARKQDRHGPPVGSIYTYDLAGAGPLWDTGSPSLQKRTNRRAGRSSAESGTDLGTHTRRGPSRRRAKPQQPLTAECRSIGPTLVRLVPLARTGPSSQVRHRNQQREGRGRFGRRASSRPSQAGTAPAALGSAATCHAPRPPRP